MNFFCRLQAVLSDLQQEKIWIWTVSTRSCFSSIYGLTGTRHPSWVFFLWFIKNNLASSETFQTSNTNCGVMSNIISSFSKKSFFFFYACVLKLGISCIFLYTAYEFSTFFTQRWGSLTNGFVFALKTFTSSTTRWAIVERNQHRNSRETTDRTKETRKKVALINLEGPFV